MRYKLGKNAGRRVFPTAVLLALCLCGCDSLYKEKEINAFGFEELCEALRNEGASIYGKDDSADEADELPVDTERDASQEEINIVDDDTLYSFELRGATLANAVNMIGDTGGVNLLLEGDFSEIIDASLPGVTINRALSKLLSVHRCSILRDGDIFVISHDDPLEIQTRIFQLQSVPVTAIGESLKAFVGENGAIVVDIGSNVISVTATARALDDVDAYLGSIDRQEKQVLIEARIIEFSLTDLYELGVNINLGNIHIDDTTATFLSDFLTASQNVVATVAGDRAAVDGALRALSKLTRVNIMSHPNVVARNEKEALIEILEEIPYIDSTVTTTGDAAQGVGTSAVENVEFKEVGIKLKVTPSILNDGCISLTLDQDVSEQVATFNNIPVVNHRHINTQFTVANNNTIIIGGLMKEYYFEEESGVPFLKDLPLLGFLFRGTTRVKEKVELVVLITPRIVSPKATIGVNSRCLVRLNGKD